VEVQYGLHQLVTDVTHGNNVLDKVFINRPDIYSTTVLCSLLKTKHSAVLVRPVIDRQICNRVVAKRKKVSLYDLRQCNIHCVSKKFTLLLFAITKSDVDRFQ